MSSRGFSLVELLVACALLAIIGGAVAAMTVPVRDALERSTVGSDLDAGRRLAVEMLAADLREAGSDPAIAGNGVRLARVLPRVVPLRDLESDTAGVPASALRITRTPPRGAQAMLGAAAPAGATLLQIDTAARCAGGPPACSFRPDMPLVVFDDAAAHVNRVSGTADGVVMLQRPLTAAFLPGAIVSELSTVSYGVRPTGDGSGRLVRRTDGGAEQPLLDHVVDLDAAPDTEDVLRLGSIAVRVRVEAPSAALRGPAGVLFRRAGTAASARRWIPDTEIRMVVTLRNPAGTP